MSVRGDVLWAWQSQQPDGGWGIISAGVVSIDPPKAMVLVHRELEAMTSDFTIALVHGHILRFNEPVRLARFELSATELDDVPGPR